MSKRYTQSGYTLLFATLTAALALGVAVFILNVAYKQYLLSSTARDSAYSFYAADAGIECVAKNGKTTDLLFATSTTDESGNTVPVTYFIKCANNPPLPGDSSIGIAVFYADDFNIPIGSLRTDIYPDAVGAVSGLRFSLGFGLKDELDDVNKLWGCTIVTIDKYYNSSGVQFTVTKARGYNLCSYDTSTGEYGPNAESPRTVERVLQWSINQGQTTGGPPPPPPTGDTQSPTVAITSPASQTYTTAQTIIITAEASDNVGVTRVEFYDGSTLKATDTSPPYNYTWSIDSSMNGTHSFFAKAYDAAGNRGTSAGVTYTVTIGPPSTDTTPPTTPTNLHATSVTDSEIDLAWTASTDTGGSGLAGYNIYRGSGALISTTVNPAYADSALTLDTAYSYFVRATDVAGNFSLPSATYSTTTLASGSGPPPPPPPATTTNFWFDLPFNTSNPPAPSIIFSPASAQGIFNQGSPITITVTSASTSLGIFSYDGTLEYSGPSPVTLSNLPVGYYFVQTVGDRNQFTVLPSNRTTNFMGSDLWPDQRTYERATAAKFGWGRLHGPFWSDVTTNPDGTKAASIDWTLLDWEVDTLQSMGFTQKISYTIAFPRPTWSFLATSTYNQDYQDFVQKVMGRYGTKFEVYEIFNEPYYTNVPTYAYPYEPWIDWADRLSDLNIIAANARDTYAPSSKIVAGNYSSGYAPLGLDFQTAGFNFDAFSTSHSRVDYYGWHQPVGAGLGASDDISNRVPGDSLGQYYLSEYERYLKLQSWWGETNKPLFMDEQHWLAQSALGIPSAPYYAPQITENWKTGGWETAKDVIMSTAANVKGLLIHQLVSTAGLPPRPPTDWIGYYGWAYGDRGPEFKLATALQSAYNLQNRTFVSATPTWNVAIPTSSTPASGFWQFRFTDNSTGKTNVWVFATRGYSTHFSIAGATRKDLWGRSVSGDLITEEPTVYIY